MISIEGKKVRGYFSEPEQKWYLSVVDIIEVAGKSTNPRNYWKVLKNRLKNRDNELVTACNQLKLPAKDGKSYLTDVTDTTNILKILSHVSEHDVLKFKNYFSNLYSTDNSQNQEIEEVGTAMLLVDAYIEGDFIFIEAMLGGVEEKDIHILATPNQITIEGRRKKLMKEFGLSYLDEELYWGDFARTIHLPTKINTSTIEKSYVDGWLRLKVEILIS